MVLRVGVSWGYGTTGRRREPVFRERDRVGQGVRDWLESDQYDEDEVGDREQEIAEAAMNAVMGPDFVDWVSDQMMREDRCPTPE